MLALPLGVGALEVFNPAGREVPKSRGDFVDQIVIVRHQQHRSLVALKRDIERVDGFEIEVVGGLIEDEDVGLGENQLAEDEACLFAAGESLGLLFAFFAAEQHLAEDAADLFDVGGRVPAMEPLGNREAVLDGRAHILWKVANLRFVSPEDGARVEREFLFGEAGIVCQQAFEQGGFAGAVAAHETDFFAAQNICGESVDDLVVVVDLGEVLELEHVLAAGTRLVKANIRALDVGAGEFVGLQALHFFTAAGDLRRAGAGGKTRNEFIKLRDLLFALGILRLQRGADLRLGHHHLVVSAGVGNDGLVVDVGSVRGDAVQKVPVVRDGNERAVVAVEKILKPVDGVEIEVVRGLVEQQRFRLAKESLGEKHADFLAALKLAHLAVVQFFGDVEAIEQTAASDSAV